MSTLLGVLAALSCRSPVQRASARTPTKSHEPAAAPVAPLPAPVVGAELARAAQPPFDLPPADPWEEPIHYVKGRGSVTLQLPSVQGARDFRVYALQDGVTVQPADSGGEHVRGATIFCAGHRQHNQCDETEAMDFGPAFHVPRCSADPRAIRVSRAPVERVQVDGLSGKTVLAVEAIASLCPFPGAFGVKHRELPCINEGTTVATATYEGRPVKWPTCPSTFPIRTEREIRAEYASLIVNGQGPRPPPPAGQSPFMHIGLPAPALHPEVLKRAVVVVEPLAADLRPEGFSEEDFFESFSDPTDQPAPVSGGALVPAGYDVVSPELYETSKLSLYTYGANGAQFFLALGTLRNTMADASGQIMASSILYPKRAFQVPDDRDRFVHVTFETQGNATQRRYWWWHACGAEEAGKTIVAGRLAPRAGIVPLPGFMDPLGGLHISTRGWNCVQLVPRGGGYEGLEGGPFLRDDGEPGRPETDIRVVINPAVVGPFDPSDNSDLVINVSPMQYAEGDAKLDGAWMREWDSEHRPVNVLLDGDMYVEQRTRFDVYFNRGRVVLFSDGVQKLCNDFPKRRLTMAEAAIGVGSVLYHSSAERAEFSRQDWLRTAQYHYRYNLPFLDQRSYDNYGVRQDARLPDHFVEGQCYVADH